MDPAAAASVSSLNAVVQALMVRQGMAPAEVEALLQAVGQELSVLFLGPQADGARLQLPSGQIIAAQGELPFPPGTQLQVRVEAEAGQFKLQTLEARPPAPPAVLAPLSQGEAAPFLARLGQPESAQALAPLVQILKALGVRAEPPAFPSQATLAQAIRDLPPEARTALAQALEATTATPEGLAQRLAALAEPSRASGEGTSARPESLRTSQSAVDWVARFQALLGRTDLSPELRTGLETWFRALLARRAPDAPTASPTPAASPTLRGERGTPAPEGSGLLTTSEATRLDNALRLGAQAPEVPATWEAWLKGGLRALADPALSPREAPFHALQGRDGTAFFELPVPWAGTRPLQIWVEEDPPDARGAASEEVRRVLLSLRLSQLGETRVGLQAAGKGLAVRIWTEHPEALEGAKSQLSQELSEEGRSVDLRILPLHPGPEGRIPDLRDLVGGTGLHALG